MENKTGSGVNSSYVPFPPQPAPELTPQEKKLLEREDFVRIEPGEFEMGSPSGESGHSDDERKHLVKITKPFYIGKFEVTVNQWNMLQPEGLKRDEKFFLPDDLKELVIRLKRESESKVKTNPNPLALNPNDRVYTVKVLEKVVLILEKKLEKKPRSEEKKATGFMDERKYPSVLEKTRAFHSNKEISSADRRFLPPGEILLLE